MLELRVPGAMESSDIPSPTLHGLPQELLNVLKSLDTTKLGQPLWSLRVTTSKVFVDLCWTRFEKPAITPGVPAPVGKCDKVSHKPAVSRKPSAVEKPRHKRKSPSTRRRDRQRYLEFRARKTNLVAGEQASGLESQLLLPIPAETQPAAQAAQVPLQELVIAPVPSTATYQPLTPVPVVPTEEPLAEEQCEDTDIDDWLIDFDKELDRSICFNVYCGKSAQTVSGGLKKCTRCNTAEYCSKACQARHWNIHKAGCKIIALELAELNRT